MTSSGPAREPVSVLLEVRLEYFRLTGRRPYPVLVGGGYMRGHVVRSLAFPVGVLPAPLRGLLAEFRLLVNRSIRIALREDIRSRARLTKVAYGMLSDGHDIYKA